MGKKRMLPEKCFDCGCDLFIIIGSKNNFVYRKGVHYCNDCIGYGEIQKKAFK